MPKFETNNLIDFNTMSTCLWLFYAEIFGNYVHCMFIHKNVASNIEQVLEATPHKAPTIRPPASHLYKLDEPDMQVTAGEAGTSS